jgi:hypothetical protein
VKPEEGLYISKIEEKIKQNVMALSPSKRFFMIGGREGKLQLDYNLFSVENILN